ncbi:MAG: EthD family reductase [Marmoricola sp.]
MSSAPRRCGTGVRPMVRSSRPCPGCSAMQQHAVDAPGATPPFLGVASLGFADRGAFEQAAASPEFAAAIADVPNFADETTMPTAFVEEVVVVG